MTSSPPLPPIIGGADLSNGYIDANGGGTADVDSPIDGAAASEPP